jgi:hypothetical protein
VSRWPLLWVLVFALVGGTGCAGRVDWLGAPPPPLAVPPAQPLSFTVAVVSRAYEATRIDEKGVLDRFAAALRGSDLFLNVMYPIPPGVDPEWELQLITRDSASEPNSNIWRSALVSFFFPTAWLIDLESEYTLDFEVLLVRNQTVVGTYRSKGHIKYVYQAYANKPQLEKTGVETIVARTTGDVIAALTADASRIEAEDRRLAGTR